ncbi:MAG: hypothetical protein M0R40_11655, partial [Firmicutes bacterium]|nr:hypothetical protein [Bacillota bacterium]
EKYEDMTLYLDFGKVYSLGAMALLPEVYINVLSGFTPTSDNARIKLHEKRNNFSVYSVLPHKNKIKINLGCVL